MSPRITKSTERWVFVFSGSELKSAGGWFSRTNVGKNRLKTKVRTIRFKFNSFCIVHNFTNRLYRKIISYLNWLISWHNVSRNQSGTKQALRPIKKNLVSQQRLKRLSNRQSKPVKHRNLSNYPSAKASLSLHSLLWIDSSLRYWNGLRHVSSGLLENC